MLDNICLPATPKMLDNVCLPASRHCNAAASICIEIFTHQSDALLSTNLQQCCCHSFVCLISLNFSRDGDPCQELLRLA